MAKNAMDCVDLGRTAVFLDFLLMFHQKARK